ncbi:MAG: ATP-binding protein [Vicinamibacterales bacterium]
MSTGVLSPAPPHTTADDASLAGLAMGLAHDCRNLLFVITAHCQRMRQVLQDDHPARADVDAIMDASERAAALTRQFLVTGRDRSAPAPPVDLNRVLHGLDGLLRRLAGPTVDLDLRLDAEVWPLAVNTTQLEQVVTNLVVNARDAMPRGGRLTVSTANDCTADGREWVALTVTDTGMGMTPEVRARIFERFFTTKRSSGGTGIGLATVQTIVQANGGHLAVETAPGKGTTMRIVFPRGDAAAVLPDAAASATIAAESIDGPSSDAPPSGAAHAGAHPAVPGTPPTRGLASAGGTTTGPAVSPARMRALEAAPDAERILLVDDEPAIRELLRQSLQSQGYQLVLASSGGEAIDLCQDEGQRVDLLVTDLHLPDIQGSDVATRIRAQRPDLQVIFISGAAEPTPGMGAAPVLTKPFSIADFRRAVRSALDARAA